MTMRTNFVLTKNSQTVKTILLTLPLTLTLFACSNQRPVYQGAEAYKNLEIPPDLTQPEKKDAVLLPEITTENRTTEQVISLNTTSKNQQQTKTAKTGGLRIVNGYGQSWLESDDSVTVIWEKIKNFVQSEGIILVAERPELDFMETDWTPKLSPEKGFFKSIFQNFEPDQLDKFRFRVESNNQQTRVIISHTKIERILTGEESDEYTWQSIKSDIETEREMLSRLTRYLGLNQAQAETYAKNYVSYSPRVKKDASNSAAFSIVGSKKFAWQQLLHALDRMNMQNIQPQKQNDSIKFELKDLAAVSSQEEDEISKNSWLMNLLRGKSGDAVSNANKHYKLQLTALTNHVRVVVEDKRQTAVTDEDGFVDSAALTEQLTNALIKQLQ